VTQKKSEANMTSPLAVKLDDETRDRLQALGKLRDRSPRWLMRTAILEYLEREETYERERREDQERWERYLLTGEAVTHDLVTQWLDGLGTDAERPCPV
jgi:predicted transcriptional regulator